MSSEHEVWIVDRIEGGIAVLVEDSDEDPPAVMEVAAELLGVHAEEGAVLIVPLGTVGDPLWDALERDRGAEEEIRAEGEERLERLRRRDPGGDVSL